MTCAKCGANLTGTSRFCGECGTPVATSPSTPEPARPGTTPPTGAKPTGRNEAFAKTIMAQAPVYTPPPSAVATGLENTPPSVPAVSGPVTGTAATMIGTAPVPAVAHPTATPAPAPAAAGGVAPAPTATPSPSPIAAVPAAARDIVGTTLNGRYLVKQRIGEGGFGAVYKGEQIAMGRECAIKVLHGRMARDPNVVGRFKREAQAASVLRAAHTVGIYDFDQTPEGILYLAMEMLHGRSLHEEMQKGPMTALRVAHILDGIADSLGEAHQQSIVHRDIKPENVFLETRGGDTDFAKVLDFGIAKIVTPDHSSGPQLTAAGQTLGTVEYMSPEQLMGLQLDGRSDLYALGHLGYELLTGHLPFHNCRTPGELITAHLKTAIVPPSQAHPELKIPPLMDEILLKLLEKQRDKRYRDAAELQEALRRIPAAVAALEAGAASSAADSIDLGATLVNTQSPFASPSSTQPVAAMDDAPTQRDLRPPAASGPVPEPVPLTKPAPAQTASVKTTGSSSTLYVVGGVVLLVIAALAAFFLMTKKAGAAEAPTPARMVPASCEGLFAADAQALKASLPAATVEPVMAMLRTRLATVGASPDKVGRFSLCMMPPAPAPTSKTAAATTKAPAKAPANGLNLPPDMPVGGAVLVVDMPVDKKKWDAEAQKQLAPGEKLGTATYKGVKVRKSGSGQYAMLPGDRIVLSTNAPIEPTIDLFQGKGTALVDGTPAALITKVNGSTAPAAYGWTRLDGDQKRQLDRMLPGVGNLDEFAAALDLNPNGADTHAAGKCASAEAATRAADGVRAAMTRARRDQMVLLLGVGPMIDRIQVSTDGATLLLSLHLSTAEYAELANRFAGMFAAAAASLMPQATEPAVQPAARKARTPKTKG